MSLGFHRSTDHKADVDDSARSPHDTPDRDTEIVDETERPGVPEGSGESARSTKDTRTDDEDFAAAAAHAHTERDATGDTARHTDPRTETTDQTGTAEPAAGEHESASEDVVSAEPAAAQDVPVPVSTSRPGVSSTPSADAVLPFFEDDERDRLRNEWREVQGLFVDDPRDAVGRAGELVTATVEQLQRLVAERKQDLDSRGSDDSADTEALRRTFRSYRSFLDQLLGTPR